MKFFFLAIIICFFGSFGCAAEFSYPPSEKVLKELKSGYHSHENGEMYFRTPTSLADEYKVEDVDLKTFEILANMDYAKDKNNIYSYNKKILEIKPEMLENEGRIKFTYDGKNYDLKYQKYNNK